MRSELSWVHLLSFLVLPSCRKAIGSLVCCAGDELISDSYDMKESEDGFFFEVDGKVCRLECCGFPHWDASFICIKDACANLEQFSAPDATIDH